MVDRIWAMHSSCDPLARNTANTSSRESAHSASFADLIAPGDGTKRHQMHFP
jgi:hypothetical protein